MRCVKKPEYQCIPLCNCVCLVCLFPLRNHGTSHWAAALEPAPAPYPPADGQDFGHFVKLSVMPTSFVKLNPYPPPGVGGVSPKLFP